MTPTGIDHEMPGAAALRHLLGRLTTVEARVRRLVADRRQADPEPDDPVRGLYISEGQVDQLLAPPAPQAPIDVAMEIADLEAWADAVEASGVDLRLRRLARAFELDDLDTEILLVALAPDLDPRFERLYGYLHDDVTRRRASTGLALELVGLAPAGATGRRRLRPDSPLVGGALVEVTDADRPFLTRTLRVPDRVLAHLLGDDAPDGDVAALELEVPVVAVSVQHPAPDEEVALRCPKLRRHGQPPRCRSRRGHGGGLVHRPQLRLGGAAARRGVRRALPDRRPADRGEHR